jgi:Zonular occludens toxin (Zot).
MSEDYKTNIFISRLKSRLKNQQHFIVLIVGRPGSGKSYTALRIAELVDENFTLENVAYTPKEFISLVKNRKEGSAIVFDEAGVAIYSREWQKKINRIFAKLIQILRYKCLGIIFTTPHALFLDKAVRVLFDYILLAEGFDRENNVSYCKVFMNSPLNYIFSYETLMPFTIQYDGKTLEIDRLYFSKPKHATEYEKLARMRKDMIIAELEKEIEEFEKDENGRYVLLPEKEKTGVPLICPKCGYKWVYTGKRNFARCPNCDTRLRVGDYTEQKRNIYECKR